METWDALRARRNVRRYGDRPIPAEDLDRILQGARRTPSAGNRQWWDFVVVTERERLQRLSTVWQGARHVASSAVTIAIVGPQGEGARGSRDPAVRPRAGHLRDHARRGGSRHRHGAR